MVTKTLLLLANSIKYRERCVAGREVVWSERGYAFGAWVRPVSGHGAGELTYAERQRADGPEVRVMEFADVRLLRHAGDVCHPEDWVIAGPPPRPWAWPSRRCNRPPIGALEERPEGLWLEPGGLTDRASHGWVTANRPGSLCMIAPSELELVSWAEFNREELRTVRKYRARFLYHGVGYDLSLTDPLASERYFRTPAVVGEGPRTVKLETGALLCVSLTPEFGKTGYHYKVVATILGV